MQFKHPELLYALVLLVIPIIVHLFQLRKFKKTVFTNVAFLKEATLQTRKSSQIKKWLILSTRLLLLASIIVAFAQPFYSKINTAKIQKETVIYLDNSFSMQAKGPKGELLKRAIQDIINTIPDTEKISLITNNSSYKNTSIKAIKNELLQLEYASSAISTDAALLKSKALFSKQSNSLKNLVLISDFQDDKTTFNLQTDSLLNVHLVKLDPVNKHNIAIDSAFISSTTPTDIELTVKIKQSGNGTKDLPISLFNNDQLIAKTSLEILDEASTSFSLPVNTPINGKITIEDSQLNFDNSLYFNINNSAKINVLAINETDDDFLKRIYTKIDFNYSSAQKDQLNYNLINDQNLIILNELNNIPNALTAALKQFIDQGGFLMVIPSNDMEQQSYNNLVSNYGINFADLITIEKRITTINYAHPLYNNGVFEKQVRNFQYPKVTNFYNLIEKAGSSVLQFEDGKSFLSQTDNIFVFTSPLNANNSSFKSSPLIVPTLYNIGTHSFKVPKIYYTIGKENTFDVDTQLQQDDILSIVNPSINIIPKQQNFNNKVVIRTSENPHIANTYSIKNKNETLNNISYNYDRSESDLVYRDLSVYKNISQSNSVTEVFNTIKSDTKVDALWKWFVIFALVLLIIEMLILKYFK